MTTRQYKILLEDEYFLIAEKESGFLTIPDRYRPDIPNLYQSLKLDYGDIYIVHRLDKGTSGLVCFAKTREVHRVLNLQFEQRKPLKKYYAIVKGTPFIMEGTINAGLAPNKVGGMHIDLKRGKSSITDYKVIESFRNFSLIEATILTGRTHQIRVHLKHLGYPLAVDEAYTQKEVLYLSEIKRKKFNLKKNTEERPLISRVPLHAYYLSFMHPVTNHKITVESNLPKDMKALLNQLRKWDRK